jgi:hypothetical protein
VYTSSMLIADIGVGSWCTNNNRQRHITSVARLLCILYRNFNHIGVRSFIPSGAPFGTKLRTPKPAVFALEAATDETRPSTPAAESAQVRCSRYAESLVTPCASRGARSSEARTQELRRLCPLFAERAQEGDERTGLGRTWSRPVLWTADESADMAISTRMTRSGPNNRVPPYQLQSSASVGFCRAGEAAGMPPPADCFPEFAVQRAQNAEYQPGALSARVPK